MPFLHGVRDAVIKDQLLRRDRRARNATMEHRTEAKNGSHV
jgi:hypothetical protein